MKLHFVMTYSIFLSFLLFHALLSSRISVQCKPYTLITKEQTFCELEALNYGTRLVDQYQSFDENTEWDMRIHHDYLVEYLGFAGWIVSGLWKSGGLTASGARAGDLHKKGGWTGIRGVRPLGYG